MNSFELTFSLWCGIRNVARAAVRARPPSRGKGTRGTAGARLWVRQGRIVGGSVRRSKIINELHITVESPSSSYVCPATYPACEHLAHQPLSWFALIAATLSSASPVRSLLPVPTLYSAKSEHSQHCHSRSYCFPAVDIIRIVACSIYGSRSRRAA
jgi:hypothetical protein